MPAYAVTQPSWLSASHEVRESGVLVGKLTLLSRWSYRLMEAQLPERTVRFGSQGWTGRRLFIQDAAGRDIAAVERTAWWRPDVAVTVDGRRYEWRQVNFWGTRWAWFGPDGEMLMESRLRWWGKMDIEAPEALDATGRLLLFFSVYLLKLWEAESMGAGT